MKPLRRLAYAFGVLVVVAYAIAGLYLDVVTKGG
jgi:hypothetical protein